MTAFQYVPVVYQISASRYGLFCLLSFSGNHDFPPLPGTCHLRGSLGFLQPLQHWSNVFILLQHPK